MGDDESKKTLCLGDEYDARLRATLMTVLKAMGGTSNRPSYGVGGSQELESLEVSFGYDKVLVEAETYVGLTVTGAAEVVDRIAEMVRAHSACSLHNR